MLQSISHGSPHVRTLLIHASANKALQASADFTLGWRGVVESVREEAAAATAAANDDDAPSARQAGGAAAESSGSRKRPRTVTVAVAGRAGSARRGGAGERRVIVAEEAPGSRKRPRAVAVAVGGGARGEDERRVVVVTAGRPLGPARPAGRRWGCGGCRKTFALLRPLGDHQASTGHSGLRRVPPGGACSCPCGAVFATAADLRKHQGAKGHQGWEPEEAWQLPESGPARARSSRGTPGPSKSRKRGTQPRAAAPRHHGGVTVTRCSPKRGVRAADAPVASRKGWAVRRATSGVQRRRASQKNGSSGKAALISSLAKARGGAKRRKVS